MPQGVKQGQVIQLCDWLHDSRCASAVLGTNVRNGWPPKSTKETVPPSSSPCRVHSCSSSHKTLLHSFIFYSLVATPQSLFPASRCHLHCFIYSRILHSQSLIFINNTITLFSIIRCPCFSRRNPLRYPNHKHHSFHHSHNTTSLHNMFSKTVAAFALFTASAQVAYAAVPPACLLLALEYVAILLLRPFERSLTQHTGARRTQPTFPPSAMPTTTR